MVQIRPDELIRILKGELLGAGSGGLGATVIMGDGSDQTINNGAWTDIIWLAERFDTGITRDYPNGIWDVANPERLTAVESGWWSATVHASWEESAVGFRVLTLTHSTGAPRAYFEVEDDPVVLGWATHQNQAAQFWMEKGEYVKAQVYQTSGGALDIIGAFPAFTIVKIP